VSPPNRYKINVKWEFSNRERQVPLGKCSFFYFVLSKPTGHCEERNDKAIHPSLCQGIATLPSVARNDTQGIVATYRHCEGVKRLRQSQIQILS
jgi:hypothetical protein